VLHTTTKKDTVNAALREVSALAARRRDLHRLASGGLPDLEDEDVMRAAPRMMRVVSCHGARSTWAMALETTYLSVGADQLCELAPDRGTTGGVVAVPGAPAVSVVRAEPRCLRRWPGRPPGASASAGG
jgi:hypothetical protein